MGAKVKRTTDTKQYRKYDSNTTKQALEEYNTTPNCSLAYVAEKYNKQIGAIST